MKNFLKTGKKALAVFMAIMMLMSAWVWVAPTKASAATAGNYYVEITWSVTDTKKYSNKFGGTETENGARAGMILYYKKDNGTGTEQKVYWDIGNEDQKGTAYGTFVAASTGNHTNSKTTHTTKCIINGFPTAFYATADSDYFLDGGAFKVTSIAVGKPSTTSLSTASISNKKTIWTGEGKCETTTEWKWFKITADGTGANGKLTTTETGNDSKYGVATSTSENWQFPTPTTTTTYTGKVDNVSIPKSGTSDAMTVKVIANDQYGVQMATPTWTVKGSVCGTTGISVDPTSGDSTTVKLTNSANVSSTTDTQTGTITATWGSAGSLSDTFTITDSYYTATFNYQVQNDDNNTSSTKTETRNGYHGDSITAPTVPQYYDQDYLMTFSAWSPTIATTIVKDVVYTATYTSAFTEADYSAVNEAIAAANAVKANYGTEYEFKYTYASRVALDKAINDVVTGLGRTQQATVDGYAQAINEAIAALDPNKFDVIFLNKDGAILLYEKDVEYKQSVKAPDYSEKYYDSTNHYTFTGWDTNEYTSVVDDLVITPVFTAEAHTYTTSVVPSTCLQKGATKYTCSCGYSYIDGETDYGDHVWNTEFTTDIHPNCTTAGQKSIHCTVEGCGAQKDITVIDPLGHQWGTQSSLVPATCENNGIDTKLCDDCGICEHTIVPALNHNYEKTSTVAPTCTTKGYDEYTCKNDGCGHTYRDNYKDTVDHNYPATGEVIQAKTCGVTEIIKYTCPDCNFVKVVNGETGYHDSLDSLDWEVVVAPTCNGNGYQVKTCSQCQNIIAKEAIQATGHKTTTETKDATCTEAGYTKVTCSACGDVDTTVINPLGHKYEKDGAVEDVAATCTTPAYKNYKCDTCGETKVEYIAGSAALTHDFTGTETITSPATCEADGEKTVQCKNCNETITVVIPKLGHSYGDWKKTDATNNKDGSWYHKCSTCGKEETLTIPKGGHNLVAGEYKAPKCNEKGYQIYNCTNHENCTVTVKVVLDYAQHDVEQRTSEEATCTTEGKVESYCSVCDKSFSKIATPVKAHNPVAGTAVAPTCSTSGYTPYACACGTFSYNVYDASKPATGAHSWTETSRQEASCTADGSVSYKCDNCTATKTDVLPKTGHSFTEDSATQATCTALATKTYKCSCGASYVENYGELAEHKFDTVVKTVPATNDSLGYEERKCTCGLTKITIIEATGTHVFNEKIVAECIAPTCTENGTDIYKCTAHTDCTAMSSVLVPRLGHTATAVYTAPTCTATGSSKAVCANCNTELSSEIIPAKGHAYNNVTVTKDADCTNTGVRTYACACGDSYTETIPAKGHDLTTTVNDAKCGEKGSVVTSCSACDYEVKAELGAKGHIWKDTYESKTDATCEADGKEVYKCTNCDATNEVVLPKLGHKWSEWVETPATTTADGKWYHKCSTCGKEETLTIPRGHNLVLDTANSKDATCAEEGKTVYICESHADCGVKIELKLTKLQHTVAQREIEATCNDEGSVEAYCSVCSEVLSKEVIPVKAHNFVEQAAEAPTCTTAGYTPYKCSACGFTYNVFDGAQATGHNYDSKVTKDATCTAEGEITYTCENDESHTYTETTSKLPHDYKANVIQAQTCTSAEKTQYTCDCSVSYVEITKEAKGHTYSEWTTVTPATADKYGVQKRVCACGDEDFDLLAPIGNHVFTEEVTTSATCTTEGLKTYTCSVHSNCSANYTADIPATGHTEKLVVTEATCIAVGNTKVICEVCTKELDKTTIPAIGYHNFSGNGVETTAPGCTTEGTLTYTCLTDGCNAQKTVVIPAKGHDLTTTVTDAKCGEKGSVVTKCTACNYSETSDLGIKGHIWKDTYESKTDATCEADGEEVYKCENCDATNVVVIPKLGHAWGEWSVTKASTNTAKGEMTRICSRGCTETVETPAGGHEWDDGTVTKAASCTETGTKVYACKNHTGEKACGITFTVTLDKLQHNLTKSEKAATCEENGSVITKCSVCDTATYETIIPATGHTYDDGVKTDATCTTTGKIVYTCTAEDCKKTKEVILDKLQHNYVAGTTVAATCISSGYTPYKCDKCESSYVLITDDATGHTLSEGESTANCTNGGKMTLTCQNANCTYTEKVDVPALGHNYQKNSSTDATCAAAATETYKCSRCEASYTISVGEKATQHTWGALTTVNATNTSLGYTTRTCDVCGQVEFNIIPATGEHKFDVETADKKAPTCTEDGYIVYACSTHTDCGLTSKVTIPANGHKEKLAYEAATCDESGWTKIICEVEGCKYEKDKTEIPALGHLFDGEGKYTAATCASEGEMVYTCSRQGCTETHKTVIAINPDAHKTETETIDATCKSEGAVVTTCTLCDTELLRTPLPKLQHEWGEWNVTPGTNNTVGEAVRTCSNGCTETVVIPAGGHTFGTTPSSYEAASCFATGTETYNCTAHKDCGVTITVVTAKTAHTPKAEITEASCTAEGSIGIACSICQETLVEAVTIGKLQHVFEEQSRTDATCTSSGYITYKCKNCTETYNEINGDAIDHELVITSNSSNCTVASEVTVTCNKCDLRQTSTVPAPGHNYVEDESLATEATCKAAATKTYKCSRCSASYTISVGDKATEHKYPDTWTVVVDATETAIGYETRTCEVCGKLEVRTIDAKGEHKYDGEVVADGQYKAATCIENGYETRRCSVIHSDGKACDSTALVTIPATGHSLSTETLDAKCENDGSVTTKCNNSNCDYKTVEVIPALGHAYGEGEVTPATCKTEGNIKYICSRCDGEKNVAIAIDKDAHNLVTKIEQATCEANGKVTVTCANGCTYKEETVIPAKGHTWNDGVVTKDATCEASGLKKHTCVNCGVDSEEIIPALGHVYVAGTKVANTCTTSGYTVYTCKNNPNHTYNVYNPAENATGHDWSEWKVVTAATETTEGLKERSCKVENCDAKETEKIPAVIHSMAVDSEKPSTCKEAGYVIYKCNAAHDGATCNYTLRVDLPVAAHAFETTVTEATCKDTGSVVTKCTNDGCGYKLEKKVLEVKTHKLSYETVDADCTADGYVKAYCTNDGCTYEEVVKTIAALGHSFTGAESDVVDATCTSDGSKKVKCSRCDETTTVTIPAKGHEYTAGEEVEATCTESGYIPYSCKCGDTYNKLVSNPKSHDWKLDASASAAADCETDGKEVYKCSCGAEKENVISKLGHSWVWTLTKNPSAKDDGILTGSCIREGCDATETVIIPALGGGTVTYTVTFVADGKVVSTQTINHGSDASAPEISKIPDAYNHYSYVWDTDFTNVTSDLTVTAQFVPNAHDFGAWETVEEASCIKAGSMKRSCSVCGYTETKVVEFADHNYVEFEGSSYKAPTCTENGYTEKKCTACGKIKTEVISRLGHSLTYHSGYAETCTEDGEMAHYSCARCEKKFEDKYGRSEMVSVVIGKKYHNVIVIKGTDATCTEAGSTDYIRCTYCGYCEESKVIPAYGHSDVNNDNCCDRCDSAYLEGGEIVCTCSCHKPGIINELIYKILRFFWKLLGKNKSCECGVLHY